MPEALVERAQPDRLGLCPSSRSLAIVSVLVCLSAHLPLVHEGKDPASGSWGSVDSDALSRDLAGSVTDDISVGVILVNGKSPRVTVVAAVQDDLFL